MDREDHLGESITADLKSLEREMLAKFHSASALLRAAEAGRVLADGVAGKAAVTAALFTEVCIFYSAALERFHFNGSAFTPSVRKANGYDKRMHRILMTFRNQIVAHRDSSLHKHKFMDAQVVFTTPDEEVHEKFVSWVISTTTVAPLSVGFVSAMRGHLDSCARYMAVSARAALASYAELWRASERPQAKSRPLMDMLVLEPDEGRKMQVASLRLPDEFLHTVPPVISDQDQFLELTFRLSVRDDSLEAPVLEALFNAKRVRDDQLA